MTVSLTDLDELSASFETAPPADIIAWAATEFGTGLVTTASFEDAVLGARRRVGSTGGRDRSARHAVSVRRDHLVRDRTHKTASSEPAGRAAGSRRGPRQPVAVRHRGLLRRPQGRTVGARPRRQDRMDHRHPACRRADTRERANRGVRREAIDREDQPTRHDVRRRVRSLRSRPPTAAQPAERSGLRLHRMLAVHAPRRAGEDRRAGRWSGSGKTECGLHV